MGDSDQGQLRVTRIDGGAALAALREDWQALMDDVPAASIFLTWDWIDAWWQNHEPEWELWVLAVSDVDGNLRGIAPWARTRHALGPLTVKRLAFAGDHRAYRNHMDVIARPEDRDRVVLALAEHLGRERREWDVLDLEALAEGSPFKSTLAAFPGRALELEPIVCPRVELPGSWDQFAHAHLSANYRWQLRSRRRKLEQDHPGVVFCQVTDASELPEALAAYGELHRQRWHAKGQGSSFDHAAFVNFHQALAATALANGWLQMYLVKDGPRVVAAEYGFLFRGTLSHYGTAFDADYAAYSPGQLLLAFMTEMAIAAGATWLDLGRGTFDYKFRWANAEQVDSHVILSRSAAGHLWSYGRAATRSAKALGRKYLSASLVDRINHRRRPPGPPDGPG